MWTNDQNKHEKVKSNRKRRRKCVINVSLTIKIVNNLVDKGSNRGKYQTRESNTFTLAE